MAYPVYIQPSGLQSAAQTLDGLAPALIGLHNANQDRVLRQQQVDIQRDSADENSFIGRETLGLQKRELDHAVKDSDRRYEMELRNTGVDNEVKRGTLQNNTALTGANVNSLNAQAGLSTAQADVMRNADKRAGESHKLSLQEQTLKARQALDQYASQNADALTSTLNNRFRGDMNAMLADPIAQQQIMRIVANDPSMDAVGAGFEEVVGARPTIVKDGNNLVLRMGSKDQRIDTPVQVPLAEIAARILAGGKDRVAERATENEGQAAALAQVNPTPGAPTAVPAQNPSMGSVVLSALHDSSDTGRALVERLIPNFGALRQQGQTQTAPTQPAVDPQVIARGQVAAEDRAVRAKGNSTQVIAAGNESSPMGVNAAKDAKAEGRRALSAQTLDQAVSSAVDANAGGENFTKGDFLDNKYEYFSELAGGSTDPAVVKDKVKQTVQTVAFNQPLIARNLGLSPDPDAWTRDEWARMTDFVLSYYRDKPVKSRYNPQRFLGGEGNPEDMGPGKISINDVNKYLGK